MAPSRVDEKAVAIVEDMIEHVLARPSMYGRPSDVEATVLTLAAIWEQFHADDPSGSNSIWNREARKWWELWVEEVRSIHGDTNTLRTSDPVAADIAERALMEQVVGSMRRLLNSLYATYGKP